ncbi:hypothetical protein [Amorphus sp. MBR-141]
MSACDGFARPDGIKAFSETGFAQDLKGIDLPALVIHDDGDHRPDRGFSAAVCDVSEETHAQDLREAVGALASLSVFLPEGGVRDQSRVSVLPVFGSANGTG